MNWIISKKQQIIVFAFCLTLIFIFSKTSTYYFNDFLKSLFDSFFAVFITNTLFSFIFLFLNRGLWRIWFKFSVIFSLIGIIIIGLSSPDAEFLITERGLFIIAYWILYSLISIGILIYGLFKKN